MKKIWQFLREHIRKDFNPKQYAIIALFLIAAISMNYAFDFEDDTLSVMDGFPQFFAYCLFYGTAYFFSVSVYALCTNKKDIFSKRDFWLRSIFAISVLSLDSSLFFLDEIIDVLFHPLTRFWANKVLTNGISFVTVLMPILIFYFLKDRNEKHTYGLQTHKFDTSPYFMMLLIMLPLLIAASFTDGFQKQYPMYKTSQAHNQLGVAEWVTASGYEIAYGLDFVTVEFLFRGFMVIGMMHLLGRGAVLSMAVTYCFLHFGKPPAEAISSIAGGYILGVIAYETKSIWGGIIVHMGIAWMMEAIAFFQKNF